MRSRTNIIVFGNTLRTAFFTLLMLTLLTPTPVYCQPNYLFSDDAKLARSAAAAAMPPQGIRARPVSVNLAGLDQPRVVLNLFQDAVYAVTRTSMKERGKDFFSWSATVDDDPRGRALMVIRQGRLTGNVHAGGRLFAIRPLKQGGHAIFEIDQSAFPSEDCPEYDTLKGIYPPAVPGPDISPLAPESVNDGGAETDVLVAYTTAAKNASADIVATIQLAIDDSNASYSNSNIAPHVRLVHTMETSYAGSGVLLTDVNRLQNPSDGYMDDIHTMRDSYRADLVVLIQENGGGYCGRAYEIMADATGAFCVVKRTCAVDNHSFAHEMGHLQGARHDRYVDSSSTPYTYGHGYINHPDRWRTVMSYNNECADSGYNCTRLQYWSNPDITYGGDAMGTVTYEDNARVLDTTASTVANFRTSLTNLSNRTPVTDVDIPKNFQFSVLNYDWCGVAIAPTTDHDIRCDDIEDCSSPYMSSTYVGTIRDFVVINGHQLSTNEIHYAEVYYGSFSEYIIEAEYSPYDLTLGVPRSDSFSTTNVIRMFEVNIPSSGRYQVVLDNQSPYLDLALFLFSPAQAYGKRSNYHLRSINLGAGNGTALGFNAVAGVYGIAVINENYGFGGFSIQAAPVTAPAGNTLLLK